VAAEAPFDRAFQISRRAVVIALSYGVAVLAHAFGITASSWDRITNTVKTKRRFFVAILSSPSLSN